MADIFISYGRADATRVGQLVRVLEARWSVFWDSNIPPGQTWDTYIGRQLETSRCVIVIWSNTSVASEFVREEAHHGRSRGTLVPVLFDKVSPPFGFRQVQAADLTTWDGVARAGAVELLLKTLDGLLTAVAPAQSPQAEGSTAPSPSAVKVSAPPSEPRETAPAQSHEPKPLPRDVTPPAAHPPVSAPRHSVSNDWISAVAPTIAAPATRSGIARDVDAARDEAGSTEADPSSGRSHSFLHSRTAFVAAAGCLVAASFIGAWAFTSLSNEPRVRQGEGYTDLVHAGRVEAISFSQDGQTLAAGINLDGVRLWHLDDLARESTLIDEYGGHDVAFHPSEPVLAIVGGDVSLRRVDDLQVDPFKVPESGGANNGVEFSADGQLLAATGGWVIGVWRMRDGTTAEVLGVRKGVGTSRYGMALSPDGAWLAADSDGDRGMVDVWRTGELDADPIVVGNSDAAVWDVAISRDNGLLIAAADTGLYLWEMQNLQGEPRILSRTSTWSVEFSPDGSSLAAGDNAGLVTLWRLTDMTPTSKLNLGDRVDSLAFSPDGRTLAAGSFGGVVRLWPNPGRASDSE